MKDFFENVAVATTVCDLKGEVIYQNQRAVDALGEARGHNLEECHKAASWAKIQEMIAEGTTNAYTIEKRGVRKLIYQTPWYEDGKVAGLVEYSIVLPADMPHKVRG
jgi:transcriptional regulator with PAS, ATPase and Fis domain